MPIHACPMGLEPFSKAALLALLTSLNHEVNLFIFSSVVCLQAHPAIVDGSLHLATSLAAPSAAQANVPVAIGCFLAATVIPAEGVWACSGVSGAPSQTGTISDHSIAGSVAVRGLISRPVGAGSSLQPSTAASKLPQMLYRLEWQTCGAESISRNLRAWAPEAQWVMLSRNSRQRSIKLRSTIPVVGCLADLHAVLESKGGAQLEAPVALGRDSDIVSATRQAASLSQRIAGAHAMLKVAASEQPEQSWKAVFGGNAAGKNGLTDGGRRICQKPLGWNTINALADA